MAFCEIGRTRDDKELFDIPCLHVIAAGPDKTPAGCRSQNETTRSHYLLIAFRIGKRLAAQHKGMATSVASLETIFHPVWKLCVCSNQAGRSGNKQKKPENIIGKGSLYIGNGIAVK